MLSRTIPSTARSVAFVEPDAGVLSVRVSPRALDRGVHGHHGWDIHGVRAMALDVGIAMGYRHAMRPRDQHIWSIFRGTTGFRIVQDRRLRPPEGYAG